MNKTLLLPIIISFVAVFVISGFFIIDVNAENKKTFIIDGYTITTYGDLIADLTLNWDEMDIGNMTLNESHDATIELTIPKSMPRLTNLSFGHFSLHAIHPDGTWYEILEYESQCFYHLEIPVNYYDYVEIVGATLATGGLEIVSIMDQSCGDFTLKQQIQNKMTANEIECSNNKHVLVERSNKQLACVYPESATKLGWKIQDEIIAENQGIHNDDNSVETTFLDYTIEITVFDLEINRPNTSLRSVGVMEIQVIDPEMDKRKQSIDWFTVHVWSDTDEIGFDFPVSETDESTGIFGGNVHLIADKSSSDGRLLVSKGDIVYAQYQEKTTQWDIISLNP